MGRKLKEYALYKGDRFILIGTAQECADAVGAKANTIRWYASEIGYKRQMKQYGVDTIVVLPSED